MPNLYVILEKEGFQNLSLTYLGGLWVLIEIVSISAKEKLLNHTVWIRNTFAKVASKWGDLVEWEDLAEKYLFCSVYWVRAKEMEAWDPFICNDSYESESSDDEEDAEDDGSQSGDKVTADNDVERDPFNLYDILNKRKDSGDDLKYPPGFTPSVINVEEVNKKVKGATSNEVNEHVNYTSNKLKESVTKGKLSSNNNVCLKRVHTGGGCDLTEKRVLWDYILHLIDRWDGDSLCLDRDLSDHRLILMRELSIDYGPTPSRFSHTWFNLDGFDKMVEDTWKSLATLAICGTLVDDELVVDPFAVKSVFLKYFSTQFSSPVSPRIYFADQFTNRYWKLLEHDIVAAVKDFFCFSKLMGIGTRPEEVEATATTMGCLIFTTPFVHLGVKVGVSSGVLKLLESIRRNFFNGVDGSERKMTWISWNKVLASKKYDGLGVSSFYALNRALLFKWVQRFFSHGSCLWTRFIKAIYGEDGALNSPSSLSKRSPWLDIIREVTVLHTKGINLLDLIRKKVGNGLDTLFWEDPWLDDLALNHKFPRLYALDNYKQITVVEKINHASMVDTFCRPPRGGAEEEQLDFLLSRMDGLILTNIPDRCVWSLEATCEFSVKSIRQLIDDSILPKEEVAIRWVKVMPIKINVFAWRVRLDKLPTRLNLSIKGIDILTIVCPLCHAYVESGSHIFFFCPMAHHLWRKLMRWWELDDIDLASYDDWLLWLNSFRLSKRLKEILEGVCYVKCLVENPRSYIFFFCPMAHHLWRILMRWWELDDIGLASYDDWLLWLNSFRLSKRLKEILEGVCYVEGGG
ncbi:RNA-directed DNA polymerase, eukaryota, reverse transcriptase zinc-binding domain protein [Tanacetum coccineum]